MRLARSALRIALGVFVGATFFLVMFEKRLIYHPSGAVDATPGSFGMPFEEVRLDVEAGVAVHGWFIGASSSPSHGTVLFSHGNAGNIADRLDRAQSIRALNVDIFLYDYRGFGHSTGEPDEEGTYRDGRAAYDYLVKMRHVDPGRIVLMGESLGCAISLQIAIERKAAGLVLEAPFASIPHMASAVYPFLPARLFVRTRYDNLARIPGLKMPLLIVQGSLDDVIPIRQGRMVFDAAPEPKQFLRVEQAHHNDVYVVGGEAYRRVLSAFIRRVIQGAPSSGLKETNPS